MKTIAFIAQMLLGLIFPVFGLNGFLHFIPMGPMPTGVAGQFAGALFASHLVWLVAGFQVAGAALLLVNRYVPFAIAILAPVVVNILAYHLLMQRQGIPLALVVGVFWAILFVRYRQYFSGLFVQKAV